MVLPDGKTPAWPAEVLVVSPGACSAASCATDASGKFVADLGMPGGSASDSQPRGMAWLPGSYGLVDQKLAPGKPQTLVLPRSLALHGHVTVSGRPIAGVLLPQSSYQVRAAYVGRGTLDGLLSVTVSAQADGRFDIGGLTAGACRLQAVRDHLWLPASRTIHVAPGVSVRLRAIDRSIGRVSRCPVRP